MGLSLPYALLGAVGCLLFAAVVAAVFVGLIVFAHRGEWEWAPWWRDSCRNAEKPPR